MSEPPPSLRVLDGELDIALLPDEELLVEGNPDRQRLARYLMLSWSLLSLFTFFGVLFIPFVLWAAKTYAKKHQYWITNSRVIVANGIIGYNVRSIPLERISDIAVRVSWVEKLMGLKSIVVRDMTGEAQAGASLMAVPDAPATQAHILDYVRQVNREAKGDAPQKLAANPYRDVEKLGNKDQMLELLGRIEENTRHLPKLRVTLEDDRADAGASDRAALDEAALAEAEAEAGHEGERRR